MNNKRKLAILMIILMTMLNFAFPAVNASKEIEIRAELLNREEVISFLKNKGMEEFYEKHQSDTYYDNPSCTFFSDPTHVYNWLRVRAEDGKITLNFKHWLPENEPIRTYCEELEFELSSLSDMPLFLPKCGLSPQGFEPIIVINKFRKSFMYKNCEISFDTVECLGDFIEIEYKGDSDDISIISNMLESILKEIGAKIGAIDHVGYAYRLLQLKFQ